MKHLKTHLVGSLAFLLLAISPIAFAQGPVVSKLDSEIADLNSAIHKKGAKWAAAETALSRLSPDELKKRVGTNELKINAQPVPEDVGSYSKPPSSLDWRSDNGNFVSAVKDQKKCGSCWAFAMTGGLESNVLLTHGASGDVDLSEQVMISCSGAGSCNGGTLDADFLASTGLPPEKYYPYTATDGDCSTASPNWKRSTYKIGTWGSVSQRLSSIKSALAKYGPLPTAFMVYEDFKHYKSGIYSYVSGKKLGGHAVLLVGYDDNEQYFIVKNSWGTDWGETGFFRIAYSELQSKSDFGIMTIAYETADSNNYYSNLAKSGMGESGGKKISQKIGPLLDQRP